MGSVRIVPGTRSGPPRSERSGTPPHRGVQRKAGVQGVSPKIFFGRLRRPFLNSALDSSYHPRRFSVHSCESPLQRWWWWPREPPIGVVVYERKKGTESLKFSSWGSAPHPVSLRGPRIGYPGGIYHPRQPRGGVATPGTTPGCMRRSI